MTDNLYSTKIIDGKAIAESLLQRLTQEISARKIQPGLAVIQVGHDPASSIYVRNKRICCTRIGMHSFAVDLPEDITESALIQHIHTLNNKPEVHGILLQLPLPKHINTQTVCDQIHPHKDVDILTTTNLGKVLCAHPDRILPCTPKGIIHLLAHIDYTLKGKHVVIVGASAIIGKPLALELCHLGATVTLCHQYTKDLAHQVQQAELLVTAIGKTHIIETEWLRSDCVVMDIGINQVGNHITGDIDFPTAINRIQKITPVPGGVGPMTVAMLMENTLYAYDQYHNNNQ